MAVSDPIPGSPIHPSSPDFRAHIEDGVYDLVDALLHKGFRTLTSCEGHDFPGHSKVRFVRIGFGEKDLPSKYNEFCLLVKEAYLAGQRFDACFRKVSIPTFPVPYGLKEEEEVLFTAAIMFQDTETRQADYDRMVAWLRNIWHSKEKGG